MTRPLSKAETFEQADRQLCAGLDRRDAARHPQGAALEALVRAAFPLAETSGAVRYEALRLSRPIMRRLRDHGHAIVPLAVVHQLDAIAADLALEQHPAAERVRMAVRTLTQDR